MSSFIEEAIERAGFGPLLTARRAGDYAKVTEEARALATADLLVVGAIADVVRVEEIGDEVHVHARREGGVLWVPDATRGTDLEILRAIALARVTTPASVRVGVDWGKTGLELAQVALAFGATDLVGPITRKSGLPIYEDETKKVKGQGQVALASIKQREIARIVAHAGRRALFVDGDRPVANEEVLRA